ncbi:MAG: protein-glutamate O-methyltransferase CheR [Gemmataceae bacterium]
MPLQAKNFEVVRELLREESGNLLEDGKEYLVETRLQGLMRSRGLASVDELIASLGPRPERTSAREITELLLNHETSFFRDGLPFEVLENSILPDCIRARAADRTLKLWSAACASGQEAYSLAILLRDSFPQLESWTIELVASDLSEPILARARQGEFTQLEINRGLPAELLRRHFDRAGTSWRVREQLRRSLQFRVINLCLPWPTLPLMDVILLRNVLIYLEPSARTQILARAHRQLRPGGFLLVGGGEATLLTGPEWQAIAHENFRYFRKR